MQHDTITCFVSTSAVRLATDPLIQTQLRSERSHNWLRISRILKSLSELGLERLNAGFLLHVLNEQSESDELNSNSLQGSMDRWWANCLRNQEEREYIAGLIEKVRTEGDFIFTREMYEGALDRRAKTGKLTK